MCHGTKCLYPAIDGCCSVKRQTSREVILHAGAGRDRIHATDAPQEWHLERPTTRRGSRPEPVAAIVVCLSVCPRAYLRNHMTTLHQFSMLVASGSVLFCHRSRCVVAQHLSIVVYVVTRFGEHKSVFCRNGWTDRAGF